ncbi:MAG: hypothetical protein COA78_15185 [Blastopirellula sp.]|nr:MAG: hypothetical protein COA78_15185 [Blastopirellula sp.]
MKYEFYSRFGKIINSGQSRSIIVCGNIYDLFWNGNEYVPLIPFFIEKTRPAGRIQIVYELNGPVRMSEADEATLCDAWVKWKLGLKSNSSSMTAKSIYADILSIRKPKPAQATGQSSDLKQEFHRYRRESTANPTKALEFMRQLCYASRDQLAQPLLFLIEAADLIIPSGKGDVASLNDDQLHRVSIVHDWFADTAFVNEKDTVVLVAESASLIHPRVSRMPQIVTVEAPSPGTSNRKHFIDFYTNHLQNHSSSQPIEKCSSCGRHYDDIEDQPAEEPNLEFWKGKSSLAEATAGLSIHALRQLLLGAAYSKTALKQDDVVEKVEEYIQDQCGEDVVEFKKPHHLIKDLVGFTQLKKFLASEFIPRIVARDDKALGGAAVGGPIGAGKTFIFEAVAAEVDMPVLVLKNLRSQWFGQTDVIFERLKRALEALDKVMIFVDEADTQFGKVGEGGHATERRLTGKIQAMMSDPRLKGKVVWLLMTARIHLLSPDIRRPGRVGDLIIPILDPIDEDRLAFVEWALRGMNVDGVNAEELEKYLPEQFSAAGFASLRSHLKAIAPKSKEEFIETVLDLIPPAIGKTRRLQTLHALINCTRRQLLPLNELPEKIQSCPPEDVHKYIAQARAAWEQELIGLE